MTHAQRKYLKKWLTGIGIMLYCVILMILVVTGSNGIDICLWIGLAMIIIPCVPLVFILLSVPFATIIWHWRLMGECQNEWESNLLNQWWLWIYRSDSWVEYITELIYEEYQGDKELREYAVNFALRLDEVKKPKWL